MTTSTTDPNWLRQVREDTPGCAQSIHLNNAGASLPPRSVVRAQTEYLEAEALSGGYELAALRHDQEMAFYGLLARAFGGQADQFAWMTSATDGYNRALSSIPLERDDVILTTRNDYTSNFIAFLQLQRRGIRLEVARDLPEGGVDPEDFERRLKQYDPRLVAITQVPSHTGLLQPVAEIGKWCRERDCWYLVDGCQSVGQLDLDLEEIGCDFFSATFRKFLRGPRGAGFLYVSKRALRAGLEPLFLDLHGAAWTGAETYEARKDARRYELWERAHAGLMGAIAALEYFLEQGSRRIVPRVRELSAYLLERLGEMKDARILYPAARPQGIITVHFPGQDPRALLHGLRKRKVHTAISWGASAQLGMEAGTHPWALRISPHYYNTRQELDAALEELGALLPPD